MRALLCFLVVAASAGSATARGVSPYLPLNIDPYIERRIEQVLVLADHAPLTRPIPAALVLDSLTDACKVDAVLCAEVRGYLEAYMHDFAITHVGVEGFDGDDSAQTDANRRGLDTSDDWLASASAYWQPSDFLSFNLGAVAYRGKTSPSGSFVSLGFNRAQLDVGYRDHWWSPSTESALLIGTQAATMPSVSLSNYSPFTRFGIRYELMLARMSRSSLIAHDGTLTGGHPKLLGMHWSIEPAMGWSLGVNRLVQFGGGGRNGASIKQILRAFLRPARYDNRNASDPQNREFGNQLGSVTSSFVFPGKVPFSVYFEYAGEDTSRGRSYLLGNSALSAGIHFPSLWHRLDLTYENTTWQNAWYVNHLYGDGLTNDGHVIGHWFGDERVPGDDVGGTSHMLKLAWQPLLGGTAELRLRTLKNEAYSTVDYDRARDVNLSYSRPFGPVNIGAEIFAGRDVFGDDFSRAGLFVNYGGYRPYERREAVRTEETDNAAEIFIDAGVNTNNVSIDVAREIPIRDSGYEVAPHLALGARRAVSSNSDLGVRVEVDDINGDLLLGFRALDYRYRFASPLALSVFLGAARYEIETPAFGIYGGLGLQWRNLRPGWDVGVDVRYATKVARDRLLPSDPPSSRPDLFYDITSATLYVSRRF
jgi:hypothetical protein